MVTFGKRLKQIRNDKNITLDKMAKDLQTTKATLSRYENNLREPKADFIKRIADYLEVSVDYLLGKTEIKNYSLTNLFSGPGKLVNEYNPELNNKDKKDIEKDIASLKHKLETQEGLMLSGELASPEAIQSIIDAMNVGMEIAKKRNKQKYTPKKYRK